MPTKTVFAGLFIALTLAGVARADMLETCKGDIETFCSDVEPGDGRISACLYAFASHVSDDCYAAKEVVDTMLERFFDAMAEVGESCKADIERLCGDVAAGGGRYLACLREQSADVSESCTEALKGFAGP